MITSILEELLAVTLFFLLFYKIKRNLYHFNQNKTKNTKQQKNCETTQQLAEINPVSVGVGEGPEVLFWSCRSTENILRQQWPVVNNIYSRGKTSRSIKKQSSSTIHNLRYCTSYNLIWNIWGVDCRQWVYSHGRWILKALVYISNYDKVLGVHNGHICPIEVKQSNSSDSLSSSALSQLTATCLPSMWMH